jgi:outer membrane protein OmpA-like peptidoglycan-associated protein
VAIKPEPVVVPTPVPAALPTPAPIVISPEPVIIASPTLILPLTKQVVREVRTISDRVHFAYKSAAIAPVTATLLDQAASILLEHPQASLTLQGHTDMRGGTAYNMKLAKQRALNAKQYLIEAGVEAERMKVVAYGKAKPAIPPVGRKGQAFNRRVEFMVLHDAVKPVPQHQDLQPRKNMRSKIKNTTACDQQQMLCKENKTSARLSSEIKSTEMQ